MRDEVDLRLVSRIFVGGSLNEAVEPRDGEDKAERDMAKAEIFYACSSAGLKGFICKLRWLRIKARCKSKGEKVYGGGGSGGVDGVLKEISFAARTKWCLTFCEGELHPRSLYLLTVPPWAPLCLSPGLFCSRALNSRPSRAERWYIKKNPYRLRQDASYISNPRSASSKKCQNFNTRVYHNGAAGAPRLLPVSFEFA